MAGTINGFSVAYTTIGGILLWSGIKGETISQTFQDLLKGRAPDTNQEPITPGPVAVNQTTASDVSVANASNPSGKQAPNTITSIQNFGLAGVIASTYTWSPGTKEFAALTEVINRESGGNPNATNAQSGAYGIAQALGHGTANTQGTVTNQYGGYGVPDSTSRAANSGNASAQLVWMMAYIQATYKDPIGAWNSEQTRGYY